MRPDELERRLRERLDALGPAPRAELLHVLMLPYFERADRIGEFWGYPESRSFAELLIVRGGPGAPSGAGWHAAGGRTLTARRVCPGRHYLDEAADETYWLFSSGPSSSPRILRIRSSVTPYI